MNHLILLCSLLTGSLNTQHVMNISISINRNADEVYTYIANPENLPEWAAGLGDKVEKTTKENVWLVNTPKGQATLRFTEKNKFRIADHYVNEVYIPIRVLEHNGGSEIVFTLFRLPNMTDEEFERDQAAVKKDLETVKRIMEER